MNRAEALTQIAELHTAWSLKHGDDVPYVPADADPHDGLTTDLSIWQADRSAPPEIDDPLNEAIKKILAQVDNETPLAAAARKPTQVTGPTLDELDEAADQMAALVAKYVGRVAGHAARRLGGVTTTASGGLLHDFALTAQADPAARQAAVSADDIGVITDQWAVVVGQVLVPKIAADYVAGWQRQQARIAQIVQEANLTEEQLAQFTLPLIDVQEAAQQAAADAANRLLGIGDELWGHARTSLTEGMAKGESVPKLAERVRAATGVSVPRAMVIARTESMSARNAGAYDEMTTLAGLGIVESKTWLATHDARTRPTHVAADGQTVPFDAKFTVGGWPADRPHDPMLPAEEAANCVVGATRIGFRSARAVMRRWYEGEVIEIRCASGDEVTVTPNHPILLADGRWVPAHLINEGDHCIRTVVGGQLPAEPNEDSRPSQIGQIYRAARRSAMPERVALRPPDLHGDGGYGQIEIVPIYGQLAFHGEPATEQQVQHLGLALADRARSGLSRVDGSHHPICLATAEVDLRLAAAGVGGGGQVSPLGLSQPGHPDVVGLRSGSRIQAELAESAHDGRSAGFQISGHGEDALSGLVSATKVIQVDRQSFVGHVYNLDTGSGWYSANHIALRNCRCTLIFNLAGEEPVYPLTSAPSDLWTFGAR